MGVLEHRPLMSLSQNLILNLHSSRLASPLSWAFVL